MARTMSSREARANFGELLGSVHYTREPVIIEKNGKPYAVLVSPQQYQRMVDAEERAWKVVEEVGRRNAHFDPGEVLALVTEEVEAVRREKYEQRQRTAQGRD